MGRRNIRSSGRSDDGVTTLLARIFTLWGIVIAAILAFGCVIAIGAAGFLYYVSTTMKAGIGPAVSSAAPVSQPLALGPGHRDDPIPPPRDRLKPRSFVPNLNENTLARVYLSDLPEIDPKVGYGTFGKKGMLGYSTKNTEQNSAMMVGGKPYSQGLSMHPFAKGFSTVKYKLNRDAKVFQAQVALNDIEGNFTGTELPLTFAVVGDGDLLWMSEGVQKFNTIVDCHISVKDVDMLELRVYCPGNYTAARALWLDPFVLK